MSSERESGRGDEATVLKARPTLESKSSGTGRLSVPVMVDEHLYQIKNEFPEPG